MAQSNEIPLFKPEDFQSSPFSTSNSAGASMPSSASRSGSSSDFSSIDRSSCTEQCRQVLESQRISFEHERAAFAEQRKLWGTQEIAMSARIAELERQVSKMSQVGGNALRSKKPEQQMRKSRSQSAPAWEWPRPAAPPTRVFPKDTSYLCAPGREARYDRDHLPSLDKALSKSRYEKMESMSVPIHLVDSTLDGITLKSTALPPGLIARLSPQLKSAHTSPPNKKTKAEDGSNQPSQEPDTHPHQQEQDREESEKSPQRPDTHPPLVNGTDAGCELTAITTSNSDESNRSPESDNLSDEVQLAPQHTQEQTKKTQDHLPQIDEDPALQGPLSLQNDPSFDEEFLKELDLKLKKAAERPRIGSLSSVFSDFDDDFDGIREIRFRRNTTNFGTAFGCLAVRDEAR